MSLREEAAELVGRVQQLRPKPLFCKDNSFRGMNFVLLYLKESDRETPAGELAKELDVSTARIAALLNTMEKSGYIERERSGQDARQTFVRLTPAGLAAAEEIQEHILQDAMLLIEKVGSKDLYEFLRIYERIRDAFGPDPLDCSKRLTIKGQPPKRKA